MKSSVDPAPDSLAASPEVSSTEVMHYHLGRETVRRPDFLAREEPLEIRVRGKSIAVTMRTPGCDSELAAGFLLSEGLVKQRSDIIEIALCLETESPGNILNVFLSPKVEVDFDRLTRHVFASSSCGLCGKASIEAVHQQFPPVSSKLQVSAELIASLPRKMSQAQAAFAQTGGLHSAALFDANGELLVIREDVGRHNAVDKVLGHGFLNSLTPLDRHILLVSGRASFEIVQKALSAAIPVIAAVSAPSSLAVHFATESGQTLIGFLRGGSMNVYSHGLRLSTRIGSFIDPSSAIPDSLSPDES
jgi:FdhD protein